MKAFLSWTLSLLLAWEPFALAASKTFEADMKNFVGQTKVAQKRMTFNELVGGMSKEFKLSFQGIDKNVGNYILPQFNVMKVKGPQGEDAYQFSANQDGKSVSFMIVNGEENVYIRVNGHNIKPTDHNTLGEYFKKFGMTDQQVAQTIQNRNPASSGRHGLLSAEQVSRMNKTMQRQYFKQLRDLMQSMEETQSALNFGKKKTSSNALPSNDKYSVLFALLNPEAQAQSSGDQGEDCVAAGYVATVTWNKQRLNPKTLKQEPGYSCGSDGNGGVPKEFRMLSDGSSCDGKSFACNPTLYGPIKNCVPASYDTTKICNNLAATKDIPDISETKDQFNELKRRAELQADLISKACSSNTFHADQLQKDQAWTCQNFNKRYDVIKSWDCNANQEFAKKYPKLCGDPQFNPGNPPQTNPPPVVDQPGQPAVPPVPPPGQPPTANQPPQIGEDGTIYCDNLPKNMNEPPVTTCSIPNSTAEGTTCLDRATSTAKPASVCVCNSGAMSADFHCAASTADGDDGPSGHGRHKKPPKVQQKDHNWWLIFGAGALGAWALYRINKIDSDHQAAYYNTLATIQSTSVTTSTVPASRTGGDLRKATSGAR